jgi:hypothetical protein
MFECKVIQAKDSGWFSVKLSWPEIEAELNKLGKDGWELISTTDVNHY